MVADLGYRFSDIYIGGGTPTVLPDELAATIDLARELFAIDEVSTETNPNHLNAEMLGPLEGRVQRMSVGVQSLDDELLKQMARSASTARPSRSSRGWPSRATGCRP